MEFIPFSAISAPSAFTTIILTCFSVLLFNVFSSILRTKIKSNNKTVPEAGGAWPLIGHLHLLSGSIPLHIVLGQMADKYGSIFMVRLGVYRAIVVNTWEVAKECLTTNDKVFATRSKSVAAEVLGYNYAMMGFAPYGPYWRHVKKISTLELLSTHRLELMGHAREIEVRVSIRQMFEQWKKSNQTVINVDMKRWFGDITLNLIFKMIVGKRYEDEGMKDEKWRKELRRFFDLIGGFLVGDGIPFLRRLDIGGYEKEMKKTALELDRVVQGWLEEHRWKRKSEAAAMAERKEGDFMDVLISVTEASGIHGYEADTVIKATCMALILAASDTTTVTLTWALSLLLNNKEALKKVKNELHVHVGKDRQVKELDIKNLVYLQAIIKETLRLYPAAPFGVPHESLEDCTISGYFVPRGTRLLLNLSKIHRDPRVWSEPNEFRPERFLTTHSDLDVRGQNYELIPFGSGRRMCPGVSMALQLITLALASFLHGFDVKMPRDEPVDMTEAVGITNLKASPLDVLVAPCLPHYLY